MELEEFLKKTGLKKLHDYQLEFMKDRSRFILIRSSRQMGKTLCLILKCLFNGVNNPDSLSLIFTATARMKILLEERIEYFKKKIGVDIRYKVLTPKWDSILPYSPQFVYVDEAEFLRDEDISNIMLFAVSAEQVVVTFTPLKKMAKKLIEMCRNERISQHYWPFYLNPKLKQYAEYFKTIVDEEHFRYEFLAEIPVLG